MMERPNRKNNRSSLLRLAKNSKGKLVAIISFLILVSTLLINWHQVSTIFDSYRVKVEYPEQDKFSILILPFNQYCPTGDGLLDVGKVLFDRFETLKIEKDLDVDISYAVNEPISNNLETKDYINYMRNHKYDMVIFGNAQSLECNSKNENQVCIKYIFDSQPYGNSVSRKPQNLSNTLHPVEVNDLLSGSLQKDIDIIVFNALGAIEQYRGNNKKALSHYEFLYDSLNVIDPVGFSELIVLKLMFMDFAEADYLVSQFKSNIDSSDTDLLLSYYSMRIMVLSYSEQLNKLNVVIDSFNNTFVGLGINNNRGNLVSIHRIGEYLTTIIPKTAIRYLDYSITMAEELSLPQELAKAYHDKSRALYHTNKYKESIEFAEMAIDLYDKSILENEWLIIRALELKAYCLINLSQSAEADNMIRQILRKARSIGINWEIANILLKITNELEINNSFEDVIKYSSIGERYCQFLEDSNSEEICTIVYLTSKGQAYFKTGKYKMAKKTLRKAIKRGKNINLKGPDECTVIINSHIVLIEGLEKKVDKNLIRSTLKELDKLRIECF